MQLSSLFARRVFFWAGVYGMVTLAPLYFLERTLGERFPPSFSHPEQYYGFIGVALAWQFAFLLIARDVLRYRLFMLPSAVEKFLASSSVFILYASGRIPSFALGPAVVDFVLGILFLVSFKVCKETAK